MPSDDREAIATLQDSIEFASQILSINTDNIEPLFTVLEAYPLRLRADIVNDGNIQTDILKNAKLTEEEYFIAPPGNIPLEQVDNHLIEEKPDYGNAKGNIKSSKVV